jgi:uncharacterized protein YciI
MFVVILRYVVPAEKIDSDRVAHRAFLDQYYTKGVFIASGIQNPQNGGVILAKGKSRSDLLEILAQDPFYKEGCAEYNIYEFSPTKIHPDFETMFKEIEA